MPRKEFVYSHPHPGGQPDSLRRCDLWIYVFRLLIVSRKELSAGEDMGVEWIVSRTGDTDKLTACANIVKEAKAKGNQSPPLDSVSIGIIIPPQEIDLRRFFVLAVRERSGFTPRQMFRRKGKWVDSGKGKWVDALGRCMNHS